MTFIFLVAYHLLFVMYSNLAYAAFIFYLYSFFFHSPRWRFVLQIEISAKYNSPLYFCFLSLFFSITLPAVRISLKFFKCGTQDFTDPGLLKIRRTLTGLSLWICLHKCFCNIDCLLRVAGKKGKESARGTMGRGMTPGSRLFPLSIVPHALSFFFFLSIIAIFTGIPSGSLCGGEIAHYVTHASNGWQNVARIDSP